MKTDQQVQELVGRAIEETGNLSVSTELNIDGGYNVIISRYYRFKNRHSFVPIEVERVATGIDIYSAEALATKTLKRLRRVTKTPKPFVFMEG